MLTPILHVGNRWRLLTGKRHCHLLDYRSSTQWTKRTQHSFICRDEQIQTQLVTYMYIGLHVSGGQPRFQPRKPSTLRIKTNASL